MSSLLRAIALVLFPIAVILLWYAVIAWSMAHAGPEIEGKIWGTRDGTIGIFSILGAISSAGVWLSDNRRLQIILSLISCAFVCGAISLTVFIV